MSFKSFGSALLKKWPNFLICWLVIGACLGVLFHHYTDGTSEDLVSIMENKLLDLRFRMRGPIEPTGKVGILAIDEKTLQRFGRWPISRIHYERAFKNLKKLGAEWVGFDVVWNAPERPMLEEAKANLARLKNLPKAGPVWKKTLARELDAIDANMELSQADRSLARMVRDYGKIVLGFFYYHNPREAQELGENRFLGLEDMLGSAIETLVLPDGKDLESYPQLKVHGIVGNTPLIARETSNFAFFNNESDPDAIMRWVTLVREVNGALMPSLSLKMTQMITGREPVIFFDELGVNEISLVNPEDDTDLIKIPVDPDGNGRILINHLGPSETIPHYSMVDVYDMKLSQEVRRQLKGKSLLLGPTAVAINDQRANPFDARINGVENHAAVIDNVLSGRFMQRSQAIYQTELLIVLVVGLLAAPIMIFGRALTSGIAVLLFAVGYYYFDKYYWFGRGQWVYMGMPMIQIFCLYVATTLYKYMTEEREKKKVKGVFGMYLAPEVVDQVLENPEFGRLGGEKKELTVFFSDVRGFTTISESLSPERLCELMNLYFTPMTAIILRSGGVLDKYIGDAIMAFWGAPIPVPRQADVACHASIQMLFELDKLRADLAQKGYPQIDIGIGLNSGPMSVGNMGSNERVQYTVMGDAVNLGSRLEGQTKQYGVKILISESTRQRLEEPGKLFFRDVDDIRVKGKAEPVRIFELMRPDYLKSESAMRDLIGEFEEGRKAYRQQDWARARQHFMACLALRPDDGPSELYLSRIEEREALGYVENWDGVYVATSK